MSNQPGFLLLGGGRSSRMGEDKTTLRLGGVSLSEIVSHAGAGFDERIFSVNNPAVPTPEGFVRVADILPGRGPMSGIHAALSICKSPALVVAPCDAPQFSSTLAAFLSGAYSPGLDALALSDAEGNIHPLLGVYGKSCLPLFESRLRCRNSSLRRALSELNTRILPLPPELDERVFQNLNTPEEFETYRKSSRI